jgi:diguanylate cyclase (GGDEF)-like protein/PAS domain S-box-containing protein
MILQGSYDYWLVALSILLAMASAYAALDLAGRVTAAQGRVRWLWLAGGAVAMGVGIWSMHYVGMLAFTLPVPVLYHYPTVLLSLAAAVVASAVGLFTVSRPRLGVAHCIFGSLALGGGIAAMHYIGMDAMRLPAIMEFRPGLVALSVVVAVGISLVALILSFRARMEQKASPRKLISALVMGAAIPFAHYTGMWAVRFYPTDIPFSTRSTVQIPYLGVAVIAFTSFLVLLTAILTSFFDRLLVLQKAAAASAQDRETRFRLLAESIPEIVWTTLPSGEVDYVSPRWSELTGLGVEHALGFNWLSALHPDDQPVSMKSWEHAQRTGEPIEMEYRIQTSDNRFRWYLVRATPLHETSGSIIRWFGTCTDIDEQIRNQQVLEEQIKRHTAALLEANARLEAEMRERALAQQELNQQSERMMQELTRRSNRATMMAKMAELLQGCTDLRDVWSVVSGMAPKIFPELRGAVLLLNSTHDALEVATSWSECVLVAAAVFGLQDCWALRNGHVHVVLAGDPIAPCRHTGALQHSYACLPLVSQGEAVGVLHFQAMHSESMHLQSRTEGEFSESELSLATTFSEQVGLCVSNIRLREALRLQSIRDPLTGLFNRRYLEETIQRETCRAVRAEHGLGMIMLDLDHFKNFNDTYGHDAGDTVLREASNFLTGCVRTEDIVCRFGGEEFLIILPVADLRATQVRAERIRSQLREKTFLHQATSIGRVTVSVGAAVLPDHGTTPTELFAAADAALYRAKREGRDRVVMAEAGNASADVSSLVAAIATTA